MGFVYAVSISFSGGARHTVLRALFLRPRKLRWAGPSFDPVSLLVQKSGTRPKLECLNSRGRKPSQQTLSCFQTGSDSYVSANTLNCFWRTSDGPGGWHGRNEPGSPDGRSDARPPVGPSADVMWGLMFGVREETTGGVPRRPPVRLLSTLNDAASASGRKDKSDRVKPGP